MISKENLLRLGEQIVENGSYRALLDFFGDDRNFADIQFADLPDHIMHELTYVECCPETGWSSGISDANLTHLAELFVELNEKPFKRWIVWNRLRKMRKKI
jgi:hypothetical protein